ncbi:MAG: hypothetical protein HFH86_02600 [Bacilli bacterium]|jgi:hypothetical protein|nr:hypothetical protein [Bacilli bacterium]
MKRIKNQKAIWIAGGTALFILIVMIFALSKKTAIQKEEDSLSEEEKNKIAYTLQENSCLIEYLFSPFNERTFDYQNLEERLEFIRNHLFIESSVGKIDATSIIEYHHNNEESGPMAEALIKKEYLKEQSKNFFEIDIKEEEFLPERILEGYGDYYNTQMLPDGGCFPYYPILNKITYDEKADTYSIYIINYQEITKDEDYLNHNQITDTELKKQYNKEKVGQLIITYQKKEDKVKLIKAEVLNPNEFSPYYLED